MSAHTMDDLRMMQALPLSVKEDPMTHCTECKFNGTPDCPVKALGDRIGAKIIAEGCTEGVAKNE